MFTQLADMVQKLGLGCLDVCETDFGCSRVAGIADVRVLQHYTTVGGKMRIASYHTNTGQC